MAKIKLTKSAVDAAQPQDKAIELRDTVVPGFLCKVTPAGRKVFMLQYRTNAGERRKPALGQYGELTVDQARTMAQEWLAGIYRRSVMLASGRDAMLDDGMGFSLVPWKPVIEQRLGQQLAATVRVGRVTWEIGRQRGLAI